MKKQLAQLGFTAQPRGPAAFKTYLSSEVERWSKIIKEADIQAG